MKYPQRLKWQLREMPEGSLVCVWEPSQPLPRFPWGLDQVRALVPAGLFSQPSDRASKSAMDFLRGPQHYGKVQEFVLPLWTSFPFILNFLNFFFPEQLVAFVSR